MTSHRNILTGLAEAIRTSSDVAEYCVRHFGRGLAINVGAYAQGIPGEADSPFCWIHAADDENESKGSDGTFTARVVVAGCVKGEAGEMYIQDIVAQRTATANGLTVNGGNKVVEDLRDMIIGIVHNCHAGAFPIRVRRVENDISHFPLEWAVVLIEYNEPEALN